jgi:hypothetical protein
MAFNYDADMDSDRDRVRFYLGDTVMAAGPRPGSLYDTNFSDAEIEALVDDAGSWRKAVAAGFEALAAAWTRHPSFKTPDGMTLDRNAIAEGYRKEAIRWRKRYGAGSTATTRDDGYTADATEYTAVP